MTDQTTHSNVLVTGGSGFLGGHLVGRLLSDGWRVRLLIRTPSALSKNLRQQCDIIEGDLADAGVLSKAVSGVEVVFHCAANVNTWDSWDAYQQANVVGVENLLWAIARFNPMLKRLVHVSTVDVYGYPVDPCDERSTISGAGFGYGESKCLGESLIRRAGQEQRVPYTIIRPTNVIGPGSQFIERMGDALQSGVMLTVDGGRVNAGFVFVDNLVDYLLWAASSDRAQGECYNVRDSYDVTWQEFITRYRTAIGGRGYVINLPFWLAMLVARLMAGAYRVLGIRAEPVLHPLLVYIFGRTCGHDASKIKSHSGMIEGVGFEQAMHKSLRWFEARRANRGG
jgi:nucleoside-diphosphate-sugar epimerase